VKDGAPVTYDPGNPTGPTPPHPIPGDPPSREELAEAAQQAALAEAQRLAEAGRLPADPPSPDPVDETPRTPSRPEAVVDDDEIDEGVEWLSTGRVRLVWQTRDGGMVELILPRPTVEEYEGYMGELEEMAEAQITEQLAEESASADPDASGITKRERELREGSRMLRQLGRARKAVEQQKRLASYVLRMTRRPVWLGSPNFYAQLAAHWLNVPLRSGDRPTVIHRVK
jgi:hypothetical protein